jgi:aspartate racemase
MRERFFVGRLERAGISVLTPRMSDQERVHTIIFDQLCRGEIRPESRDFYFEVVEDLRRRGAEGIILGCTEIPLILKPEQCSLPLFNTTLIHAENALQLALEGHSD